MPNRDIGIDVKAPTRDPTPGDRLNPFNGSLPVRGSVIVGTVVSAGMQGTVVVEKQHSRLVTKYERIEKRTRRYPAHVPSNIDVREGDEVSIAECRPISKTVNFVVVENRGSPAARLGAAPRTAVVRAAEARPTKPKEDKAERKARQEAAKPKGTPAEKPADGKTPAAKVKKERAPAAEKTGSRRAPKEE
jgi:small subunit ribosomal protein S17